MPPKSVMAPNPIVVRRFADVMEHREAAEVESTGFGSCVFRTICASCNSKRLGSVYDPALARFANAFGTWVRAGFELHLTLPDVAVVTCQPALVARAIVGNLLAAEPNRKSGDRLPAGALLKSMRRYFLSDDLALPGDFQILVWPYPSTRTVSGRGIGHWDTSDGEPIVADTLKFYPLAFAVVSVEAHMPSIPASRLRPDLVRDLHDSVSLEINLRTSPGLTWPERPRRASLVLVNRDRVLEFNSIARRSS